MTAFRMLTIEQLHESSINPRKSFNKERLDELTASVKAKGVLQPLVVRSNADGFEIVCGARRYRAAKAAALTEIPAIVRELTDGEVLEVAVIENLQRDDVHPLEEAEGYERLLKLPGYTADSIAEKVGKSRAYVYAQLKLCALSPAARQAFYDGKLSKSTALLVARIPVAKLQEKAAKEISEPDHRGDGLPYRQAMEHIHRNYMLRLKEAPFMTTDPKLLPKVGACGECPKRTGNQLELFEDVGSADVCTDPACFSSKREAHFAVIRRAAEAKGQEVISGKAAKELKRVSERFPALSSQELWRVLIDLVLAWHTDADSSDRPDQPKELHAAAARHGVDAAAIRTEILAAEKAKLEEAKAAAKEKATKAKKKAAAK